MASTSVVVSSVPGNFPVVCAAHVAKAAGAAVTITVDASAKPIADSAALVKSLLDAAAAAPEGAASLSLSYGAPAEVAYFSTLALTHLQSVARVAEIVPALDAHLALRTALLGDGCVFAGADVIVAAALLVNKRADLMLSGKDKAAAKTINNVKRWLSALSAAPATHASGKALRAIQTGMGEALAALAAATNAHKAARHEKSKTGSFDIHLEGAEMGKVVTRFPPEPSGYLHLGHVKALMLNAAIAEMYQGTMLLRFDDTNPSKETGEFVDNIMYDLKTLGITYVGPTHTSDYMELFTHHAKQLIAKGRAYVDDTPVEQMRAERMEGVESKARNGNSIEENQRLFEEMLKASEEGMKCCLRAKIDMSDPNKCMRDPTLFRCNLTPHHRHGTTYKAYPTYDFACPIIDSVEGVTHTLRTTEYHDRNAQYYWVCDACEIRRPCIWDFSRLNFVQTLLSKRKLQWFVDKGLVEGWFDPRFPTVQGILRRGLSVATIKDFMISQGASKNINLMEWDKIWALNRAKLEPTAPRYNAVLADAVPFTLEDITSSSVVTTPLHQKNAAVGTKAVVQSPTILLERADAATLSAGSEFTLMSWGNAIVTGVEKDAEGNVVALKGKTNLAGDFKSTALKAHWVGYDAGDAGAGSVAGQSELVPLTLVEYDHLITVPKLEEDQSVLDVINPKSKTVYEAKGEAAMRALKEGDFLQLQRKGFYRVDKVPVDPSQPIVLIYVPDGKPKDSK